MVPAWLPAVLSNGAIPGRLSVLHLLYSSRLHPNKQLVTHRDHPSGVTDSVVLASWLDLQADCYLFTCLPALGAPELCKLYKTSHSTMSRVTPARLNGFHSPRWTQPVPRCRMAALLESFNACCHCAHLVCGSKLN